MEVIPMKSETKNLMLAGVFAATLLAFPAGRAFAHEDYWKHEHQRWHSNHPAPKHPGKGWYKNRAPSYERRADTGRCAEAEARIDRAHTQIRKWEGTGRHEKVVSWYKGDLRNAQRALAECRSGRAGWNNREYGRGWDDDDRYSAPWWRDSSYDPDDRYDQYDRYDDPGSSFSLEENLPSLLGLFLGGSVGQ
jgi:hypothetical protein